MAEQFISSAFFKNLNTIGLILLGGFYLEDRIVKTIKETIDPIAKDVKVQNEDIKQLKNEINLKGEKINKLESETNLSNYKWGIYENEIKDFLKPEEVKIKIRNGK
jgi:hypothetical protein